MNVPDEVLVAAVAGIVGAATAIAALGASLRSHKELDNERFNLLRDEMEHLKDRLDKTEKL